MPQVQLTKEIYGDTVVHTPWLRPGFELGLEMQRICNEHPQAVGILMGQHGLINWGSSGKECYDCTLTLIEKAAVYVEAKYEAKVHPQGSIRVAVHHRRRGWVTAPGPPPPPRDQRGHRVKKRNLRLGKSCRAICTHTFLGPRPTPSSLLIPPWYTPCTGTLHAYALMPLCSHTSHTR